MKAMSIKWKLVTAWSALRYRMEESLNNEEGIGTVEIVLLILVAVGLVLIFKDKITELVNSIFSKISSQAGKV